VFENRAQLREPLGYKRDIKQHEAEEKQKQIA
jgi:hypothetical protein